jgi:hypothetical protein
MKYKDVEEINLEHRHQVLIFARSRDKFEADGTVQNVKKERSEELVV